VQTKLQIGAANDRYEHEADRVAHSFSAGRASAVDNIQPIAAPTIQRRLKFKESDLKGNISDKAKRAGRFGRKSTFWKLKDTLRRYWSLDDTMKDKINNLDAQYQLLLYMQPLTLKYLKEHKQNETDPQGIMSNTDKKRQSVVKLRYAIQIELEKV